MKQPQTYTREIAKFILAHVSSHPKDITSFTAEKFGLTRQAILRHIKRLVEENLLIVKGKTRDRTYALKPIAEYSKDFFIVGLEEDKIWREEVRPLLPDVSTNALTICEYGLTEMINNVIDHSEGSKVCVELKYDLDKIQLRVTDDGVGIFKKIQSKFGLDDQRHAILELSKGKLTTDPEHHTGEGVFFTSRIFDFFGILSNCLFFAHNTDGNDWLLERDTSRGDETGTMIVMEVSPYSTRTVQSVFNAYANADGDFGFSRTHIPVALAKYGDENLVSRSQAKRLLARVDRFKEIVFDFKGVETIGQAFADEIFRVFQRQNPQIHLHPMNANEQVQGMISRAINQQFS
jgi:anti-sigma regulatory factor (Ser/Thr protein kinase)